MLDDTSGVPPPKLAALHVRLLHLLLADEAASGWWPRDAQPRDEPRDRPGSGGAASAEGSSAVVGGADEEPQQRVLRGSQLAAPVGAGGWAVEGLVGFRRRQEPGQAGREEWLVKWAGYSRGSSTWEPLDNLGDSLHAQAPPQPAARRLRREHDRRGGGKPHPSTGVLVGFDERSGLHTMALDETAATVELLLEGGGAVEYRLLSCIAPPRLLRRERPRRPAPAETPFAP
ncbi:hypothetical protein EMIHUDRAFT_213551 [Emiliania huxleyi CCMP1516]|uniref:Chromo domain-containing protein n=2 Tax=Emiliania huxleyi TaxID=2903 RepID=A0A0D3IM60_EMIH1|nr:hypothetical protein EMIHUDRAFT_213551 [Emiliania huxleyi CCMP1516]EOD12345.1 hypothetical protein EMIHUDRAFT_213551 [Emiliania huxleyi CCMP1516]|eukprot:XP_005764774.1 hypothetical protein EMIHUDRAFT_213551 [Emiliania huxleyi CCMP1516]